MFDECYEFPATVTINYEVYRGQHGGDAGRLLNYYRQQRSLMIPLTNTRILDLTRLLPGAICTMLLGDLGAEIIKIEDPIAGDYARQMPPLIKGMGAFFRSSNRGKKSIVLDLKQAAGQAVLHRLVETR